MRRVKVVASGLLGTADREARRCRKLLDKQLAHGGRGVGGRAGVGGGRVDGVIVLPRGDFRAFARREGGVARPRRNDSSLG